MLPCSFEFKCYRNINSSVHFINPAGKNHNLFCVFVIIFSWILLRTALSTCAQLLQWNTLEHIFSVNLIYVWVAECYLCKIVNHVQWFECISIFTPPNRCHSECSSFSFSVSFSPSFSQWIWVKHIKMFKSAMHSMIQLHHLIIVSVSLHWYWLNKITDDKHDVWILSIQIRNAFRFHRF